MSLGLSISKAANEQDLVRLLAKLRLRSDYEAAAKGIKEAVVDSFSDDEVLALPEATIVSIVDAYLIMHKQNVPEAEIFKRLDMQRSLLGENTTVPRDINLRKYVKWRLSTEFSHLSGLEGKLIDVSLLYVVTWFSRASKSEQDWANADKYAAKVMAELKEDYLIRTPPPMEAVADEPVSIEEEATEKDDAGLSSSGKRGWFVIAVVMMLIAAGSYWLFLMGGLDVMLELLGETNRE